MRLELQEAIVSPPWVGFAVRPRPGIWEYVRINVEELIVEELDVSDYLAFKEQLIGESMYVPLTRLLFYDDITSFWPYEDAL